MPGPSRDRILELILESGRTANEIAEILGLTANAVRQQLVNLERDGLVRLAAERRTEGRPAHVYEVTRPGVARTYLRFEGDPVRMAREIHELEAGPRA